MFGQKDDNGQDANDQNGQQNDGPAPVASATTDPANTGNPDWQHPGTPLGPPTDPTPPGDVISPAGGFPSAPSSHIDPNGNNTEDAVSQAADDLMSASDVANSDLVNIKQKALSELSPLIDQLNLAPEDKFRTIMMMIQASDNQDLVEKAYEEINYFTQPPAQS
jgi:hypothetical protein